MKRGKLAARNRGSVATLAFVAVVPLLAAFGGIAVDSMHYNDAMGELQRATDAAALAGAEDLNNYIGSKNTTASSVSSTNEEPVNFALDVATMNAVDGPIGLWQSSNRTVNATIRYDSKLSGPANRPNRCDVSGQIFIRSLFAKMFGNFGQTVSTTSSAGYTALNTLPIYMPLLVSWVDPDPSGDILSSMGPGSTYTVEIKQSGKSSSNNSNNGKSNNSVWIWNNNQIDIEAIKHIANPSTNPFNPADIPPESIGDYIKSDNGQKSAGQDFGDLLGKDVGFIVTGDSVANDILAQGQPVHQIIGFVGMHVTGFDASPGNNGYSLTGTLEPLPASGSYVSTAPATGVTNGINLYQAKLIQ